MIIVAVETSSLVSSVAIIQEDSVLVESSVQMEKVYAEQLPVMLDRALSDADIPIECVDGFAVSIGPGSYTGLRVGLSLAKGLSFATGKPLVTVPTLDIVAYGVPYCLYPVCAILDARRHQVYTAQYHTTHGLPERRTPYQALALGALLETVTQPTVFAGTGAIAYRTQIQDTLGETAHFPPDGLAYLSAIPVAFLGREAFRRGDHASLYEVEPLYLKRPLFKKQQTQQSKTSSHSNTVVPEP